MFTFHAGPNGCRFKLYRSTKTHKFRVKLDEHDESGNWDYEDEAHAADMTEEVCDCKSLEEAREVLGL